MSVESLAEPDLDIAHGRRRVHLVGIGGAGMSGLAALLVGMGHHVSGSDAQASKVLGRLDALGVATFVGHAAGQVGQADLVAYSTAVRPGNPEVDEARRRGLAVYTRPELTGAVCRGRRVLTVSGTHGKTTTTAMLAAILDAAGWAPGYLVGGELAGGRGGAAWGTGEWLVVEGDESDGTFLRTHPYGVVVTNVEADHLDFYGDMAALDQAFARFVAEAPGPKVVCLDDPGAARLAAGTAGAAEAGAAEAGAAARVARAGGAGDLVTYGTVPEAAYRVVDARLGQMGASFELSAAGVTLGRFELALPGLHNVRNAAGALAMALSLGVSPADAARGLASYRSVARRFELRGRRDGVTFVDDYAHNPGKVRAVLAGARAGGWDRVVAVFQPHRFTRTAALWREFGPAFADADVVVLTDIYPAGEPPLPGVSGRLVLEAVRSANPGLPVEYVSSRAELVSALRRLLRPGDLCLSMGAGDITTLPDELLGTAAPAEVAP